MADYTYCDDLIANLAERLEISARAPARNTCAEWERRVSWKTLEPEDLPIGAVAQIRRENLLDQRLWETWREARDQTADIRPRALQGRTAPQRFISNEATRFVNQIARRILRRWGTLEVVKPENWGTAEARQ